MDFQELDFVSMEVMKMTGVIFSIPSVWYDFEHFGYKDLWNYLKKKDYRKYDRSNINNKSTYDKQSLGFATLHGNFQGD